MEVPGDGLGGDSEHQVERQFIPSSTPKQYWAPDRIERSGYASAIADQTSAKRGKMGKFCPPSEFPKDVHQAEKYDRWQKWKSTFDISLAICDGEPTEFQEVGLLHTHVGEEVRNVIRMLKLPPMHGDKTFPEGIYAKLSTGLDDYFHSMVDESIGFARFSERQQLPGESAGDFAVALHHLGEPVGIGHGSMAFRHRFLSGLANRGLAGRAVEEGLSMEEVIKRAGRIEQSTEVLNKSNPVSATVMAVSSEPYWKKQGVKRKAEGRGRVELAKK